MGAHTTLDLLAWLTAFGVGMLAYRWRLSGVLARVAARVSGGYFAALAAGAIGGAYLFGTLNLIASGIPGVGRSILGGICGAVLAVELYKWRRGVTGSTGTVFVLPLCASIAVGRIGCHLEALADHTFGVATARPWGVDHGDGILRHPVALYESAAMTAFALVFAVLLWRRSPLALNRGFYLLTGWYGAQRFGWEFLKPYAAVIGPLNLFHLLCLALIGYSAVMLRRTSHAQG
ncbi:MAG: prolipoprotein diacylglyceryl transferase [Nitrospirota bacterium]|nr:prolipoprotein diacylglyceryl transferase [Nitrospirota bacterium]